MQTADTGGVVLAPAPRVTCRLPRLANQSPINRSGRAPYVGPVLDNIGVIEVTVLLRLLLLLRQVVLVVRRGWTSPKQHLCGGV